MVQELDFGTLLVPIDFSRNSTDALEKAVRLVSGDSPVLILLHVIDSTLPEFVESHELGQYEETVARMRERAESGLNTLKQQCPDKIEVDVVISVGRPFLEIVQKSKDFAVDAIVMSKVGQASKMEGLLFGSTAEKVIRGSGKPVLVLP